MPTREETEARAAEIAASRAAARAKDEENRAAAEAQMAQVRARFDLQRNAVVEAHTHAKTAMKRLREEHAKRVPRVEEEETP